MVFPACRASRHWIRNPRETKVLVADGGTVVIGGIIVTQQQTSINQVPVLGSLPRDRTPLPRDKPSPSIRQELLFFLTPRIIPGMIASA